MEKISQVQNISHEIAACEHIKRAETIGLDLGSGRARLSIQLHPNLFYKVLGEKTGLDIEDEGGLLDCVLELAAVKKKLRKSAPPMTTLCKPATAS